MAIESDLFFARRLGLGLRPGEKLPAPPRQWAMDQLRQVPPLDFIGPDGKSLAAMLPPQAKLLANFDEACRVWETYKTKSVSLDAESSKIPATEYQSRQNKEIYEPYLLFPRWRDCLARTLTAVNGKSPVFERFWMFWCNHFTVATPDTEIKLFYGPHTANIRRRMIGSFEALLYDAIANPAMLIYLNNNTSTGPHSRAATGETRNNTLNENLGRELLELHTLSPSAGYTQSDVVETALVLTGWQYYAGAITNGGNPQNIPYGTRFNAYRHEPGTRTILGKTYAPVGDGENQLRDLIHNLAVHPATAQHLSTKLARHFIADDPPTESIDRITRAFATSGGNLVAVHSAVVEEVLARAQTYPKMTTPENWLLQAYRTTGAPVPLAPPSGGEAILFVFKEIGQSLDECPQPNGFPDRMADWLSKEMLDRRVRQAYRIGATATDVSADSLADYAVRLAGNAAPLVQLIRRAESRAEAVALLLASPQFLKM